MNTSSERAIDDPDLARWGLLALALVVGAFLMVYYVQLLQDSVARGAQWRYSQQIGQQTGPQIGPQTGQVASVRLLPDAR